MVAPAGRTGSFGTPIISRDSPEGRANLARIAAGRGGADVQSQVGAASALRELRAKDLRTLQGKLKEGKELTEEERLKLFQATSEGGDVGKSARETLDYVRDVTRIKEEQRLGSMELEKRFPTTPTPRDIIQSRVPEGVKKFLAKTPEQELRQKSQVGISQRIKEQASQFYQGAKTRYITAEEKASEFIKRHTPSYEETVLGKYARDIELAQQRRTTLLGILPRKVEEVITIKGQAPLQYKEFEKGLYEGARERPLKTAGFFALGYVAPAVLGVSKVGAVGIASKVPIIAKVGTGVSKVISPVAKVAIPTLYAGSLAKGAYEEELKRRGGAGAYLGRTVSTELVPLTAGGLLALKTYPKISGYLRTRGRVEVPAEKIVQQDVLIGQKTFPTAPRSQQEKLFMEQKYRLPREPKEVLGVYHATSREYLEIPVPRGEKVLGGVYTAPSVSTYFLRVKPQKYSVYGGNIFPDITGKPTIVRIYPQDIKLLRPDQLIKTTKYLPKEKTYQYLIAGKKGIAYIPRFKAEVEAIIPAGSQQKIIGETFFTKIKGVKVPIQQVQMLDIGTTKGITSTVNLGNLLTSYRVPSRAYTISPLELIRFPSSRRPSKPSSVTPIPPSSIIPTPPSSKLKLPPSPIKYPRRYTGGISYITPIEPPSPPISPIYTPPIEPIYTPITPSYTPPTIPTSSYLIPPRKYTPPIYISKYEKRIKYLEKKISKKKPAFQAWIKTRGKFISLGVPTTKGRARRLGAERALQTLSATFKVVPTRLTTELEDIGFQPSPNIFRTYKILKGRRVPLEETWIQKRGKRLLSRTERISIQIARKDKSKKIKWI